MPEGFAVALWTPSPLPCYNGKDGAWGTDDGSARGHSVQTSLTQSRGRESRGSKTLWWGQGAKHLAASGQKRKIFLQKPLTNRVGDDIIVKLTHSRTSSKNENASKKLKKFEKSVDK